MITITKGPEISISTEKGGDYNPGHARVDMRNNRPLSQRIKKEGSQNHKSTGAIEVGSDNEVSFVSQTNTRAKDRAAFAQSALNLITAKLIPRERFKYISLQN